MEYWKDACPPIKRFIVGPIHGMPIGPCWFLFHYSTVPLIPHYLQRAICIPFSSSLQLIKESKLFSFGLQNYGIFFLKFDLNENNLPGKE